MGGGPTSRALHPPLHPCPIVLLEVGTVRLNPPSVIVGSGIRADTLSEISLRTLAAAPVVGLSRTDQESTKVITLRSAGAVARPALTAWGRRPGWARTAAAWSGPRCRRVEVDFLLELGEGGGQVPLEPQDYAQGKMVVDGVGADGYGALDGGGGAINVTQFELGQAEVKERVRAAGVKLRGVRQKMLGGGQVAG